VRLAGGRERGARFAPFRRRALCDDEAEGLGVLADAGISRDDGDRLWCIAEKFDRGQMDGIERPIWFDGERTADSCEDRPVNVEDKRAPLECPQGSNGALFFCGGQPAGRARPDDGPAGLGEGQG